MRPIAIAALALGALGLTSTGALARGAEEPVKAQTVSMEAVALPIVVDGRLLNYVFCSIRLDLQPNVEGQEVRAKEPLFRDDLVRAGHRTPFVRAGDYTKVDEAKVRAEVLRFAVQAVGPGKVRTITITKQMSQKLPAAMPADRGRPPVIIP